MKTIILQFFNQKKRTNSDKYAINNLLTWINENPVLFLWTIWISYLCLDITTTFLTGKTISSYPKMMVNFVGGGVINQFWFTVMLPNLVLDRKWKKEISVLTFLILLFFVSKLALDQLRNTEIFYLYSSFIDELVRILHFLIFTTAMWGFNVFTMQQKAKNEMEISLLRLKIAHRSLQLSSHFVLNMITQYSVSILHLSKDLFKDLSKFTVLLGYSYKSLDEENFLFQEIEALDYYVDCQRQRFGRKLNFIYKSNLMPSQIEYFLIPKLTLLTLLENMFKHGNCFNINIPALAIFKMGPPNQLDSIFTCQLFNSINNPAQIPSTEFGISSVNRILEFYFKDDFQLLVSKNNEEFNLFLTITYHENFTNRTN